MKQATKRLGLVLCTGVAGCFPPPHFKADATGGATTGGDTSSEATDTPVSGDVPAQCSGDEQCGGLAVAPCVVGRCEAGKCVAAQVAVTCDDGDPCTTADRCAAGTCKGRAFTAEEAKNWALVLTPTGPDDALLYFNDVAVHPSGEVSVVGSLRGLIDIGHGRDLETFEEAPVYLRLSANGTILEGARRPLASGGDGGIAHTLVADGEEAVIVGALEDPLGGSLPMSALQRLKYDGGVLWTTPPLPGGIVKALAAGSHEVFVVGVFVDDISFAAVGAGSLSFHASGKSDLYVARVTSEGEAVWVKSWSSAAVDVAPALVPLDGDLLIGLGLLLDEDQPAQSGHFDGLLVGADRIPALFKVHKDGAPSSLSTVPGFPDALLLSGYAVPPGDVIATMMTPGKDRAGANPGAAVYLGRFFPDGAAPRWSVNFAPSPSAVFPGPIALALPYGKTLVVWSLTQQAASIAGWPVAIPPGDANTLFGVWSEAGVLAGS